MIEHEPLAIANARGVPGTATAIVTMNGVRCVLTCHHVVFGNGARRGDRVWALPPDDEPGPPVLLGRTAIGELGRVGDSSDPHFLDCAVVELDPACVSGPTWSGSVFTSRTLR